MLVEARGHPMVARACALLSESSDPFWPRGATASDLLSALDAWQAAPPYVKDVARHVERLSADLGDRGSPAFLSEEAFRRSVLSGYQDRVARRRDATSNRFKLASGTGAVLSADSGVVDAELVVALDVRSLDPGRRVASRRPTAHAEEGTIVMASRIEAAWLSPTETRFEVWFDDESGQVRGRAIARYDELTISERSTQVDDEAAACVLADAWLRRGPSDEDARLLRRLKFADIEVNVDTVVRTAAHGRRALADVRIATAFDPQTWRRLDRDAPDTLRVPSGRSVRLEYAEDGSVAASVKLQELFGLAETPRIGRHARPLVLSLLAPNGRPVQVTQDLRSFWNKTYAEVRKELRGRYPKHPWPEDPWRAEPTARAKRRERSSS